MHSALLIDEVLEVILEHCSDWQPEDYRWTLCQVARSCKAWKDPALDRLWKRLAKVDPLLLLLNEKGDGGKSDIDREAQFRSYAARVKHIAFPSTPCLSPSTSQPILPHLVSANLHHDGCLIPLHWIDATALQSLDVDVRASSSSPASLARGTNIANLLSHSSIVKLRVRGWMTQALNNTINTLGSSLQSLILHTGKSLTAQTLAAISLFPRMEELNCHASHIEGDSFLESVDSLLAQYNATILPSFSALHTLRIRGTRSLFCAILTCLPFGTLRSLYLETEDPEQGVATWKPTFDLLVSKTSDSLIEFTLDQILEPEEMDAILSLNTERASDADTHIASALDTLRPLRGLKALKKFTVDGMILPEFTDKDLEDLAKWWPNLEHLDLGTLPGVLEHGGAEAEKWKPKVTVKALEVLAKCCPGLRSLTLPLDICENSSELSKTCHNQNNDAVIQQRTLTRLLVGYTAVSEDKDSEVIPAFVRTALRLFPEIQEIECTSLDRSVSVDVALEVSLKEHGLRVGTLDGFANGR